MAGTPLKRRTNYLRAAFLNSVNLATLAAASGASVLTHSWWVAGAGLAVEAVWMALVPENRRFRRAIDARSAVEERQEHLREMQEQAAQLPAAERQRVQQLGQRAAEVKAEVHRNPRLHSDFLDAQFSRLDDFVAEFIQLAVTTQRCESYLNRSDVKQISRECDSWQQATEHGADETARLLARQNVAVLKKRLAIVEEISRFVSHAHGQMSLIQNTIALLRDEVLTMATPEALSLQLEELVTSVEAIREAAKEVEAVVGQTARIAASPTAAEPPEAEGSRAPVGRVRT